METKILIKDNSISAMRDVNTLNDLVSELNSGFKHDFNSLNIGKLTTEILRDSLTPGGEMVEQLIRNQADNDVKKIVNVAIKKAILSNVEPLIIEFKAICTGYIRRNIQGLVEYIQVVKDGCVITAVDGAKDIILEKAQYYIDDPKQIEIYNELKQISDSRNRLLALVGPNCKMSIRVRGIDSFLEINTSTYETKPCDSLDYSLMQN